MDYVKQIEDLEMRLKEMKANFVNPVSEVKEKEPEVSNKQDSEEDSEDKFFNELSDEVLERFVDGMLTVLGELELEGMVPEIETPAQAKSAMLAVIRRLYLRKSLVSRMSRKFARFGAKRFLRKQKTAITKAMS